MSCRMSFWGFIAMGLMASVAAAGQYEEVPFEPGRPMPPANIGEAWCIYVYPAEYETVIGEVLEADVSEQIMIRPETAIMTPVAPVYKKVMEAIVVAPEYDVGVPVPAQFQSHEISVETAPAYRLGAKLVPKQALIEVCPAYEECVWIPAAFKTEKCEIVVEPERKELRKMTCVDGTNIDCCMVVGVPAKTETVEIQVLDRPGRVEKRIVPAKTQSIAVQVIVTDGEAGQKEIPAVHAAVKGMALAVPATVLLQKVPARLVNISRMVVEQEASVEFTKVPAVYQTITRKAGEKVQRVLKTPERVVWRKQLLFRPVSGDSAVREEADFPTALEFLYGSPKIGKNFAEAHRRMKALALSGNQEAMFYMGVLCANGIGVDRNRDEAFAWHQKAAERGEWKARYNLDAYYGGDVGAGFDYQKGKYPGAAYEFGGVVRRLILKNDTRDEIKAVLWHPDSRQPFAERAIPPGGQTDFGLGDAGVGDDWGIQAGFSPILSLLIASITDESGFVVLASSLPDSFRFDYLSGRVLVRVGRHPDLVAQ